MPAEHRWSVDEHLKDEDPLLVQGRGGRKDKLPAAKDVPKVDFKAVLSVYPGATGAHRDRQEAAISALSAPSKIFEAGQAPLGVAAVAAKSVDWRGT
jgi:hypothetical protein